MDFLPSKTETVVILFMDGMRLVSFDFTGMAICFLFALSFPVIRCSLDGDSSFGAFPARVPSYTPEMLG